MEAELKPRAEFLQLAQDCGARITGKPDGSEAIEIVFSIEAWRAFDRAQLQASPPLVSVDESAWWAALMGAAADLEQASNSITIDADAKCSALGAATFWRKRATELSEVSKTTDPAKCTDGGVCGIGGYCDDRPNCDPAKSAEHARAVVEKVCEWVFESAETNPSRNDRYASQCGRLFYSEKLDICLYCNGRVIEKELP